MKKEEVASDHELAEDLKTEYRIQGRKCLERLENSVVHLGKVCKGMKAMEINTDFQPSDGIKKGFRHDA